MPESFYKDIPILANESTRSVQEAIAQGYDFRIGEILSKAASLIKGLKLPMFLALFASSVFDKLTEAVTELLPELLGDGVSILASVIISGFLWGGSTAIVQRHIRGEKVVFINDFLCVIPIAKTLILACLLIMIFMITPIVILAVLLYFLINSYLMYSLLFIYTILFVYLCITYGLVGCIIVNNPGIGAWEALETSRKLVNKHWFKVFGLFIVLSLIVFISAIPLGIGLLWTTPLLYLSISILYQTIIKQ